MKMLIFTLLAKVRHTIESIKDSDLVAVRHMINLLDSGYNLEQYMNSSTIWYTKLGLQI